MRQTALAFILLASFVFTFFGRDAVASPAPAPLPQLELIASHNGCDIWASTYRSGSQLIFQGWRDCGTSQDGTLAVDRYRSGVNTGSYTKWSPLRISDSVASVRSCSSHVGPVRYFTRVRWIDHGTTYAASSSSYYTSLWCN